MSARGFSDPARGADAWGKRRGAPKSPGGKPPRDDGPDLFSQSEPAIGAGAPGRRAFTIAEITRMISDTLEEAFPALWIEGEISNYLYHSSGHMYFTLKDEGAQIKAVIWRTTAQYLRFPLKDGDKVLAFGRIEVYAPRGQYQVIVEKIEPAGLGALQAAFEELKKRLAAEGLFAAERKVPLPAYPRRIGLVTSREGAAVRDMVKVIRARWPRIELILAPVKVQGEGAAQEIARAIEAFNELDCADVLIVGRGGGSLEDLWAFNEEATVRAVAASRIPIVSAVGHEVDVTLCDLAADVRAATPSNAGEIVVPELAAVEDRVGELGERLGVALGNRLRAAKDRVALLAAALSPARAMDRVHMLGQRLDDLQSRLEAAAESRRRTAQDRLRQLAGKLEALSPLGVLTRGYSITRRAGERRPLVGIEGLIAGDRLETRLAGGWLRSRLEDCRPADSPEDGTRKENA